MRVTSVAARRSIPDSRRRGDERMAGDDDMVDPEDLEEIEEVDEADDIEIDDNARAILASGTQKFTNACSHGTNSHVRSEHRFRFQIAPTDDEQPRRVGDAR